MSIVALVSGGMDSTVMVKLMLEEGITPIPLFIDYGQLGRDRELEACRRNLTLLGTTEPKVASLSGYGRLLPSGLTDPNLRVREDAFLPGRNMMFLTVGGAYAYKMGSHALAIGLLDEAFSLFPDQTRQFVTEAQEVLSRCLGVYLRIVTPLMSYSKADVVAIARHLGITGTYSCHAGGAQPCGECIACLEYRDLEV